MNETELAILCAVLVSVVCICWCIYPCSYMAKTCELLTMTAVKKYLSTLRERGGRCSKNKLGAALLCSILPQLYMQAISGALKSTLPTYGMWSVQLATNTVI